MANDGHAVRLLPRVFLCCLCEVHTANTAHQSEAGCAARVWGSCEREVHMFAGGLAAHLVLLMTALGNRRILANFTSVFICASCPGRVRTKTVKKVSRLIIER